MQSAEFEEREYETPLYHQLQKSDGGLWSPGQVLEQLVGFDRALLSASMSFWDLHKIGQPPKGIRLSEQSQVYWRDSVPERLLPDFSLNLFIQAKRPLVGSCARKQLEQAGLRSPYWKFQIKGEQQVVLASLQAAAADAALVCYASAAFHKRTDLFLHSSCGTVVEASTFPTVSALQGHTAWYYNAAGCSGIANPVCVRIEETPLIERIRLFRVLAAKRPDAAGSFSANLRRLATAVEAALRGDIIGDAAWRRVYFQRRQRIDRFMEDVMRTSSHAEAFRNYLYVAVFVSTLGLQWHSVAQNAI